MRDDIFNNDKLGPVARNIIKLWYTGTWFQLPNDWRKAFSESDKDTTFTVTAMSFTEGLLWKAIDANPSGAKAPGYGGWVLPPRINYDNGWVLSE